jgi:Family of unknown function (DUF5681)
MPENRLDHLIHLGGVPQNRVAHPEQARPGNKNNASILEVGKATRWKPGQSGNPGGRPKKTPYADACRALADLTEEQVMERNPQDSFPLAVAKAVGCAALEGGVRALAELANRAEGRPAQAITQQSDESSIAALGPGCFDGLPNDLRARHRIVRRFCIALCAITTP